MVYRALGALISSSGLSLVFAEFHENAGTWTFEIEAHKTYTFGAVDSQILEFIEESNLEYKIALITIHSEITNDTISYGPAIAVVTGLPVITNLSALDIALGGNGEFYKTAAQKLEIDVNSLNELNKTLCVSFMGILRWREEYNFLSSVTGASRSSIGGAIWLGQEG